MLPSSEYLNVFRWRTYICQRLWKQTQPSLLPDSVASAPRFGRVCSQMRMRLLPRSLTSFRSGLREWGERGRECGWRFKCLLCVRGPHFASKVSYSASPQGGVPFRFRLSISMNQPSLWLKTGLKYYQRFRFANYQWMAISANPIGSPALIMRVALWRM